MSLSTKVILITAGDPNGISTEITIKAIENLKFNNEINPIIVTDPILVQSYINLIGTNLKIHEIKDNVNFTDYKKDRLNIFPIKIHNKITPGRPDVKNVPFIKSSITTSVQLYMNSAACAIVTNPINKHVMHKASFIFEGHTDFLASLSEKKKKPVMMLVINGLKTVPLTIHVPIKDVPNLITKELISSKIKIIVEDLKNFFNIKNPRIIVTGLNPHAGENGDLGEEEIKVIKPAIVDLKKNTNLCLTGPVSADTAFSLTHRTQYDVAVCMYHDQALIPIKTLDFHNGVNITLGLDFIRTSPDHGTGFDIAGKNLANPQSLISAIYLAYEMSINRDNV